MLPATEVWHCSGSTRLSKFASILESTSRREIYWKSNMEHLDKHLWDICSSGHSHYSATQARCLSPWLGIYGILLGAELFFRASYSDYYSAKCHLFCLNCYMAWHCISIVHSDHQDILCLLCCSVYPPNSHVHSHDGFIVSTLLIWAFLKREVLPMHSRSRILEKLGSHVKLLPRPCSRLRKPKQRSVLSASTWIESCFIYWTALGRN